MRSKAEIVTLLTNPGIIAVVRAQSPDQVLPLTEALVQGGVISIEITMTTPGAIGAIRQACREFGLRALIGVGTVLDSDTCRSAVDAGAEFVVSPICRRELVSIAHAAERPVMLGAYTPTEAQTVHETGADFVKLFPADNLGPGYVKALRAPLPHLRIVPTGGVDVDNVGEFLKAGCVAVGAGSSLAAAKLLREQNWGELTRKARQFVAAALAARTST